MARHSAYLRLARAAAGLLAMLWAIPASSQTIPQLPAVTPPVASGSLMEIYQGGGSKKTSVGQLGSAIQTTGPYTGEVAQTLPPGGIPPCLNIFRYLTPAQQAKVQAGTATTSDVDFAIIAPEAEAAASYPLSPISGDHAGAAICLPPGKYPFSAPWNIQHGIMVLGSGGGGGLAGGAAATQLVFPANTSGIYINQTALTNCAASSATTTAAGTVIQDLAVVSTGSSVGNAGDGIRMCVRAVLERVNVYGFPHYNVWVDGSAGNANEVKLDTVNVQSAIGLCGVYIKGGNSNAGTFNAVGVLNSGGCGIYDGSFLQNSFVGAHVDASNALNEGAVTYSGHNYSLISATPGIGASTTPGTNNFVWYDMGTGSGYPAWSGSGTYIPGNPILADSAVNRSGWVSPYVELGYPVSHLGGQGIVLSGNITPGAFTTYTNMMFDCFGCGSFIANQQGFGGFTYLPAGDQRGTYNIGYVAPGQLTVGSQLGAWSLENSSNAFFGPTDLFMTGPPGNQVFILTSTNTSFKFGRTAGVPNVFWASRPSGFAFGTTPRIFDNSTSIPSTTGNAVGEVKFNVSAAAGDPMGWQETVQGTPDTWRPLGPVGGAKTVATLPSCTSTILGQQSAVSDASSPTFLGTLSGGGTTFTPVICDGTAWRAG